ASRKTLLRKEVNLLARVMASNHRVFVLTPEPLEELEEFYRQCYRLKTSLDILAAELGRAALYNRGAFGVVFDSDHPSGWRKDERKEEQLRLHTHFSEQEAVELFRPRLKPADMFEHEIFDVGYRNG